MSVGTGRKSVLHQRFQSRLREERKSRGLTQLDMAKRLGMKQPSYADIESGPQEPKLSTIERVAAVLEIDPFELLTEKVLA